MDQFITLLRALACVLITNAHYEDVYPIKIIANGGLLGDVIFFAVSGYCIYNIRYPFHQWYLKRILRIYPAVWFVTIVYLTFGFYEVQSVKSFTYQFLYPTNFHFVGSIMTLYVLYYCAIKMSCLESRLPIVMVTTAVLFFGYYAFIYDKSVYTIDVVRNWEIRVLFLEAMLLGAWFRKKRDTMIGSKKTWLFIPLSLTFLAYMGFKLSLTRSAAWYPYQIVNWILLYSTLALIFRFILGFEERIRSMPKFAVTLFTFISMITLETYVVQYELIPRLSRTGPFPVNFIIVSVAIILAAYIINQVVSVKNSVFKRMLVNNRGITSKT